MFWWMFSEAVACAAGAGGELECRWADVPPVIDGRADEAVWQRATVIDGFGQPWAAGAPRAREGTRVRLLWDREWLYLFAEMDDAEITATVREHDGPMWQNDVVEIFLKPSEAHAGYYEFEVNPFGAVVDAFFPNAESRKDRAQLRRGVFHVDAKVALRGTLNVAGDRDTGWTVEARIPWSDLAATGGRPAPSEVWRATLTRVNGTGKAQELSSTAPLTQPSFHRTEEYGALRFVGPEPIPRAGWKNTRLRGSPDAAAAFATERAWPRLAAGSMVALVPAPGGEWLWFVDQDGGRGGAMRIGRVRCDGDGSEAETLLTPDEQVTSVIFHPRFAENGWVFLGANGPQSKRPRSSRVVRYTVRGGRPDPETRRVIIEWPSDGHNGGGLAFGADGKLFVTSGDGTSNNDRDGVGQDPGSMRSKILRIDVDQPPPGKNYAVPADNPFVGDARFVPETWAYGLRNPWRLTFDAPSGQLWVGENGQDAWEYAHVVQRGANYGWALLEGSHRHRAGVKPGPHAPTPPTIEFSHAEFRSLTGGVVYRGRQFSELVGAYVFGDFGTGRVWAAKYADGKVEWCRELVDTPLALTHVTAGVDGEILLADYGSARANAKTAGGIYRLSRAVQRGEAVAAFPDKLSETGLFADTATLRVAPGVLAYEINAPGWHDGASGRHHLALPTAGKLEVMPTKTWEVPNDTVLAQTLEHDGRRIETRVLVKQQDDWAGYTFRWQSDQRDAVLVEKGGADMVLANGQPWRVPSRAECMMCHTREANFALALHEAQLNRGDQLARWEAMGLLRVDAGRFERMRRNSDGARRGVARALADQRQPVNSGLLPRSPEQLRKFAAVGDEGATVELRARSYLAVNCGHCHAPSGGGNSAMDFEWTTPVDRMHAVGEPVQHGDFGITDARVIAPGAPGRSVLVPRMGVRGQGQMPPVASRVGDAAGLRLMVEWIQTLRP